MKLIIADINELIKIGLRTILQQEDNIEIVGEAKNNDELLELTNSFEADIILIDYTADGFNIDVVPKILKDHPNIRFVAITPEQSALTVVHAVKSGIMSYVKKDCSLKEIKESVQETNKGNKFFCGQILETIARANIDVEDIDLMNFNCDPIVMTEREMEIIKLISEGYTNGQIADMLFLSSHTVGTHRKNIMQKLGVKNTAGIVMYAVKTNIVSPNKFLFSEES
ncbi:MAG: response regulator transcription factor [Crocinitomicaceae bacterium]|nr:response regulator transcription factor [Crocinitomicaceae bacterium]